MSVKLRMPIRHAVMDRRVCKHPVMVLFWILISGEVCVASDAFATMGVFFQVTVCSLSGGDSM
jgi:hypothetical protein